MSTIRCSINILYWFRFHLVYSSDDSLNFEIFLSILFLNVKSADLLIKDVLFTFLFKLDWISLMLTLVKWRGTSARSKVFSYTEIKDKISIRRISRAHVRPCHDKLSRIELGRFMNCFTTFNDANLHRNFARLLLNLYLK